MQNIHHSLPPFPPYSFFQKLSVLFFPVYVIFFMSVGVEMCTFWQAEWMRPFIAVRLTLKQKTDAFRVRVFMYVSFYLCVLWVNVRLLTCARTCRPLALSACLVAAQNFTWHQSACKEIVISLQASCSWLKPAVATSLSLSSPPFFVFFPFPFPSTSPWHK